MRDGGQYIAIDRGTTNRCAYLMGRCGTVLGTLRDDPGVLAVGRDEFAAELPMVCGRLGALPVIAAGLVGSTPGWRKASYVPAPSTLPRKAQRTAGVDGSNRHHAGKPAADVAADPCRFVPVAKESS